MSILKNIELHNLSKWIVWYVNYISINLFLNNSISPHFLIPGRPGPLLSYISCFPSLYSFCILIPLSGFMPLILDLLSLCFSVSPPSLIPPLLHFSLPKNSRKFSEALLLQVCACRESIRHRLVAFQWANQLHSCPLVTIMSDPSILCTSHGCVFKEKAKQGTKSGELPMSYRASGHVEYLGSGTVQKTGFSEIS